MKWKKINSGKIVFLVGSIVLGVVIVCLFIGQKTAVSRPTSLTQIKNQRLSAIATAQTNHQNTYYFEVSGTNFLTMPIVSREEERGKQ